VAGESEFDPQVTVDDITRRPVDQHLRDPANFVKMECTLYGLDVYTSEVDDKGIDFVIRRAIDRYYDIQVKGIRGWNYVFFAKSVFWPRPGVCPTYTGTSSSDSR
jgi:hypothetical protein